jgi:hypothetical protein
MTIGTAHVAAVHLGIPRRLHYLEHLDLPESTTAIGANKQILILTGIPDHWYHSRSLRRASTRLITQISSKLYVLTFAPKHPRIFRFFSSSPPRILVRTWIIWLAKSNIPSQYVCLSKSDCRNIYVSSKFHMLLVFPNICLNAAMLNSTCQP